MRETHKEISGVDFIMFGKIKVLFGDKYAF